MSRTDLEGIEADLQSLRIHNPMLHHVLKMIEDNVISKEHGYAALIRSLVVGLKSLQDDHVKLLERGYAPPIIVAGAGFNTNTSNPNVESGGEMSDICATSSPWPNAPGGCILPKGHTVCEGKCRVHKTKSKCGQHKLKDGRVWPYGFINRKYA